MPQAETLLARAAALDAQEWAGGVDVAELPRAAVDAGIGAAAFDAAVPATAAFVRSPRIVRMTMIDVPNRVVAWGFYAFFLSLLLGSGAAVVATKLGWSPPLQIETSLGFFVASFSGGWNTLVLDWQSHGYDRMVA